MIDSSEADWTGGLSKQLRALIYAGADDSQLDRLILARKLGDDGLLAGVINEVANLHSSTRPTHEAMPESDLRRLQRQVLSLVVNDLSSTELNAFVRWLMPISELLYDKYRREAFWSHQPALTLVATAVCDDIRSRIESTADMLIGQAKLERGTNETPAGEVRPDALLDAETFAGKYGCPPDLLPAACNAHRIFCVTNAMGATMYPAFFVDPRFNRRQLAAITKLLGSLAGGSKWQFFTSAKGSLGSVTPLEALLADRYADVRAAALGFAAR